MPRLLLPVFLILLLVVAFLGGRFTAKAPAIQPEASLDGPMAQAWEDFIRAQRETLSLYRGSEFFVDDQERAEAYRSVLYALVGSIKSGALMSRDHPRLMTAMDWASKGGLDNPDNNDLVAMLHDDEDYRVSGQRGSSAKLEFQLLVGQPGVAGTGTTIPVSVLDGADIQFGEDGSFEIIISRDDPGPGRNWLVSDEGAETLLVRQTHVDWGLERPGLMRIERMGAEGESAVQLTPAIIARGLRRAAVQLFERGAVSLEMAERTWNLMPRNGISAVLPDEDGREGQYSAFGSWQLDNGKAIILSTAPSSARYQGIQLANLWLTSLDYETRATSLSLDQMECSADGRCYTVISHRDPGIQNWLDTEGHLRGLIVMRWQGLPGELPEAQQPTAQLVDFSRLREELPEDVALFSPEQRREQIRQRRANVHERNRG